MITHGWWSRFCKRLPQLSLRKGDPFQHARAEMTNYEVFKNYFDLLGETLDKYDLKDKPSQIYNCDESGMPLEHKLPRTISAKGTKKVRQCSSGNKTQITVLGCASATGQALPPMVIFAGKKFNHTLSEGEIPGTLYGVSDSGWMDHELFALWFSSHFLQHAVSSRPLLLLLDGHSSHYTLELIQTAADHDVVIFCLPPHTTADTQPLDTSVFGPLKTYWSEACRHYMFDNPGRIITKFQFSNLFSHAWSKGMSIENIVSGFRSTGIYPFNPNAILDKVVRSRGNSSSSDMVSVSNGDSSQKENIEPGAPSHGDSSQKENEDPNVLSNGDKHAEFDCSQKLSLEKITQFETRYENGYNVDIDEEYIRWLQQAHPNSLPSFKSLFASVDPLELCLSTGEYWYVCVLLYVRKDIDVCVVMHILNITHNIM